MTEMLLERKVGELTVGELKELVRDVLAEIRPRRFRDSEGYLVFLSEEDYRDYLSAFPGKLPGEINAYYLTPIGHKVSYSDWTLTPEAESRLAVSLQEMEDGSTQSMGAVEAELNLAD